MCEWDSVVVVVVCEEAACVVVVPLYCGDQALLHGLSVWCWGLIFGWGPIGFYFGVVSGWLVGEPVGGLRVYA